MKDLFKQADEWTNNINFFSFMFWLMPSLLASIVIITSFMMYELSMEISKTQSQLTAICFGIGAGVLLYRVFVIAYNDIKYTN